MIHVKVRRKPDRPCLQLYYVDPRTGQERTRSAKTKRWRDAERAAASWERDLSEKGVSDDRMSLGQFTSLYEEMVLLDQAGGARRAARAALSDLQRHEGNLPDIGLIDELMLARWRAAMMRDGRRPATVKTYMARLRASLQWAKETRLIGRVPSAPRGGYGGEIASRGRALTTRECWRLVRAARAVRPRDWRLFTRVFHVIWLTGLRRSEVLQLSWDRGPILVDMNGGRPLLKFEIRGHKARRYEVTPVTPECAAWLARTPLGERSGPVCPGLRLCALGVAMARISEASGVVVNDETGAFAGCHDLRRTFGTRWSYRVKPLTLQRLMRHKDIKTTLKYYVHQDADEIAKELWGDA